MKKNGFIATSVLYSFFLVFITLFILLITNYLRNQILLHSIEEDALEKLSSINNMEFSNLKVGDYVRFSLKKSNDLMNKNSKWILAYIEDDILNNSKKYYFLSDLDMQNPKARIENRFGIEETHPVTIDIIEKLIANNSYKNAFFIPNVNVEIPTTTIIENVLNLNLEDDIKNSIISVPGDYVISSVSENSPYEIGYYNYRYYNFSNNMNNKELINSYCGLSSTGDKLAINHFGNVAYDKSEDNHTFIRYCNYANTEAYNHLKEDLIVKENEEKENDKITDKNNANYNFRLMAVIEKKEDKKIYISGGKGIAIDPYLISKGKIE